MMKLVYHVAIIDPATNQVGFLTDTHMTLEHGKPAARFPRQIADGLMYELIRNGQPAVVIKAPAHYELTNQ